MNGLGNKENTSHRWDLREGMKIMGKVEGEVEDFVEHVHVANADVLPER